MTDPQPPIPEAMVEIGCSAMRDAAMGGKESV